MILRRIKKGIGLNGKPFPAKQDGKKSVLKETGDLYKSFEVKISDDKIEIVANVDYASFVDENRPFMGLTEEEEEMVWSKIRERIEKNLQEYLDVLHKSKR